MHKKAAFCPEKGFLCSWLDFTAQGGLSVSCFFGEMNKILQRGDYFGTLAAVAFIRRIIIN
jgi:hypothetical protein